MTLSTITAGILITVVTASLEILHKVWENEREEFENS